MMSAAEILSVSKSLEPDEMQALGRITKALLCHWAEWSPAEIWDDAICARQAEECVGLFGEGAIVEADVSKLVAHAGAIQRDINATRAAASRAALDVHWPGAPLLRAYALSDRWNRVIYFAPTGTQWTCFAWSTSA